MIFLTNRRTASMKKLFLILGLVLGLGACAQLGPKVETPISPEQVYLVENGYGVLQSAALVYDKLPSCDGVVVLCSDPKVVKALAEADAKARVALDALESFTRNPANYPNTTYGSLFQAAQVAVEAFRKIELNNKLEGVN